MHETTPKDLFYNLDDIINLFSGCDFDKYVGNYRIKRQPSLWTGESCPVLTYFKRIKSE